jgi:hypothetical protein
VWPFSYTSQKYDKVFFPAGLLLEAPA